MRLRCSVWSFSSRPTATRISSELKAVGPDVPCCGVSIVAPPVAVGPTLSVSAWWDGGSSPCRPAGSRTRSEEHTSELQSLMRIPYAVFCLQKKNENKTHQSKYTYQQIT